MGHALKPHNGTLLSAQDVAARLRKAFPYVTVDPEEGGRQALSRAEWIESRPPGVFLGRHEEALAFAARLRNLAPGDALSIEFGEDSTKCATIVVIPDELIQFGYRDHDDEDRKRSLVERCAKALDCEVVLF